MELYTIGTGSSGNTYLLVEGSEILILDAGVKPIQRISKYLYDLRPARPVGCLITHEHGDHSASALGLYRMGINCYASPGTADMMETHAKNDPVGPMIRIGKKRIWIEKWVKTIRPYDPTLTMEGQDVRALGNAFLVMAFKTNHDAAEPCGFLITNTLTGERMVYATDTYYMTYRFPGIHYWLIECNYCDDLLTEDTPPVLAKRLSTSHMSLERLCQVFKANDLSSCRQIILCHASRDRADPARMAEEIHSITGKPVVTARAGLTIGLNLNPF